MNGVRDAIINSLEQGALFQSGFVVINEDIIAWANDTINALTPGGAVAASSDATLYGEFENPKGANSNAIGGLLR